MPSASNATLTGNTFSRTGKSAALLKTWVICTAKRRGLAKLVVIDSAVLRPAAFTESDSDAANASPSLRRDFGGSSSVNTSIKSVAGQRCI